MELIDRKHNPVHDLVAIASKKRQKEPLNGVKMRLNAIKSFGEDHFKAPGFEILLNVNRVVL